MKIRNIFLASLALASVLFTAGCSKNNDEPSGAPSVEINPSVLTFEKASSSQTFEVVATRAWKVNGTIPEWVSIEPTSGKATNGKEVKVTVLENTGLDRNAEVKVTIGFDEKTLTISQKGTGSADDAIVYKNDFDKEEATKTYGTSSSSYPYLDQFDGWKNETGSGIANVSYAFSGMSARSNSTSNSGYSDYEGSGSNNLFFGTSAYFSVQNLALSQGVNYTLSFGSERYVYGETSNTFSHSEFQVYVSNDAKKWVELEYVFPNGDKDGRWDQASSTFTVPEGTTTLSLYFKTNVASAYRLDDVVLSAASTSGTVIDFSKGTELDGGSSDSDDYSKAESKTVAEFIAAANTSTYYKLKGTVSGFNSTYCSFDITDETGSIYVYSVTSESKTAYVDKIKNGGTVEIAGKYAYYSAKEQHEVVDAQILSYEDGDVTPGTKMTIAEVLAAAKGTSVEVEGVVAATYNKGFVITDGTDYLLIYDGSTCAADVKDKVTVTGTTGEYNGIVQVASPKVTVASKDSELNLPEPKVLDATAFDAYSSDKIELISYTGTLVSGDYVNITVLGASKYTGSLSYIPASFNASSYDGKVVKVTGFFIGISSSKYINTMTTKLEEDTTAKYLSVSTKSLTAKADDTSVSFKVSGNVKWTVTSDNADYTVSPASGEGESDVNVTFAANTSESAKTVKLTVSTEEEVATKSYEITLTHSGTATADYTSDVEFTVVSDNKAYAEKVKINGDETEYYALKLGTSSKGGSATVTLPAGTTAVKFYAYAWKGKTATLTFTAGGTTVGTQALKANSGCSDNSPYSLVDVAASDEYTIPVTGVTSDTVVTVSADKRAVIFAVKLVK